MSATQTDLDQLTDRLRGLRVARRTPSEQLHTLRVPIRPFANELVPAGPPALPDQVDGKSTISRHICSYTDVSAASGTTYSLTYAICICMTSIFLSLARIGVVSAGRTATCYVQTTFMPVKFTDTQAS